MSEGVLVPADLAAHAAAVDTNTIYVWRHRGKLTDHGRDERGRLLFAIDEVLRVERAGRRSARRESAVRSGA